MSRLSVRHFLRKSSGSAPGTSPSETSRASTGEALIIHDNPLFSTGGAADGRASNLYLHLQVEEIEIDTGSKRLKLRDIIANVPFFHGIDSSQLRVLTERIVIARYKPGEYIIRYGQNDTPFVVMKEGRADVMVKNTPSRSSSPAPPSRQSLHGGGSSPTRNSFSSTIARARTQSSSVSSISSTTSERISKTLYPGDCHNEQGLVSAPPMMNEALKAVDECVCILITAEAYKEVMENIETLLDVTKPPVNGTAKGKRRSTSTASTSSAADGEESQNASCEIDFTTSEDLRSLKQYVGTIARMGEEFRNTELTPRQKSFVRELCSAYTPELNSDEVIAVTVSVVRRVLCADRVGLFLVDEQGEGLILKASRDAKGIRLPMRGLAGFIVAHSEAVNIRNAYTDERFDPTMDRRTGYTTRQLMGVPIFHPRKNTVIGALQVNNRIDTRDEPFTEEQQKSLELAAQHLAEILIRNRAQMYLGLAENVISVRTLEEPVALSLSELRVQKSLCTDDNPLNVSNFEVWFRLYHGLEPLCTEATIAFRSNQFRNAGDGKTLILPIEQGVTLDIQLRSIPRAARLLCGVRGLKGKGVKVDAAWGGLKMYDYEGHLCSTLYNIHLHHAGDSTFSPTATTLQPTREGAVAEFSVRLVLPVHLPNRNPRPMRESVALDLRELNLQVVTEEPETEGNSNTNGRTGVAALRRISSIDFTFRSPSGRRTSMLNSIEYVYDNSRLHNDRVVTRAVDPPSAEEEAFFDEIVIICSDPEASPASLTPEQKARLRELSSHLYARPQLLVPYLMAVNWADQEAVAELYDLLDIWERPTTAQALQLLDRRFPDPKVRAFAIMSLRAISDQDLSRYLLQLCQQLKFEPYHDSALARFLLDRALSNKHLIGHGLFWFLRSEMHVEDARIRFAAILQLYIRYCGDHRLHIGQQVFVMRNLEQAAMAVKEVENKEERHLCLQRHLMSMVFPAQFQLPLDAKTLYAGVFVPKCRVMSSKKKPLWLHFWRADRKCLTPPLSRVTVGTLDSSREQKTEDEQSEELYDDDDYVILMFKAGDDLRQDQLTLQLLSVMNDLWVAEGLDMQMHLYSCVSTGEELGMIEVVKKSNTLAEIIMKSTKTRTMLTRKASTAFRAYKDVNVFVEWLQAKVLEDMPSADQAERDREYERRRQNFTRSCAAYCVATFVLGIGDRHNDNVMMTHDGHFFHIDFGHFLGRFKKKFGVKRERAPFVFTPAMEAVIGGRETPAFEEFVQLCCRAYLVLRRHLVLLCSLLSLAIPCGIPELTSERDVKWVYDHLVPMLSDEEAAQHMRQEIMRALDTKTTRLNDAIHMIAHA